MRRLALVLALLLPSLAWAAPVPDWARPRGPTLQAGQRQTLGGAYARSVDRFEVVNRGAAERNTNVGLWGRINSTNRAADDAERPSRPPDFVESW